MWDWTCEKSGSTSGFLIEKFKYLVEKIRTQYTEKEHTELDALKALDKKVKKPANIFAYSFGIVSSLIMGSGMSLIMTDIGSNIGMADPKMQGLIIGILGMLMAIINYSIYKRMLNNRRRKYAKQIVALSNMKRNGIVLVVGAIPFSHKYFLVT